MPDTRQPNADAAPAKGAAPQARTIFTRRPLLQAAALAVLGAASAMPAFAQSAANWPDKTIRLVHPYAGGAAGDVDLEFGALALLGVLFVAAIVGGSYFEWYEYMRDVRDCDRRR